jgi:hypothetical protein
VETHVPHSPQIDDSSHLEADCSMTRLGYVFVLLMLANCKSAEPTSQPVRPASNPSAAPATPAADSFLSDVRVFCSAADAMPWLPEQGFAYLASWLPTRLHSEQFRNILAASIGTCSSLKELEDAVAKAGLAGRCKTLDRTERLTAEQCHRTPG